MRVDSFMDLKSDHTTMKHAMGCVHIGKRISNPKRDYYVFNDRQGKEVPTSIKAFRGMVQDMLSVLEPVVCAAKGIFVIGFAETAVGLGGMVACGLHRAVAYYQTTREVEWGRKRGFTGIAFSEPHSHAPSQMLFGSISKYKGDFDTLVFVDDELTTGNTLLSLVESLRDADAIPSYCHIVALSYINCQNEEAATKFREAGIEPCCVVDAAVRDPMCLVSSADAVIPPKELELTPEEQAASIAVSYATYQDDITCMDTKFTGFDLRNRKESLRLWSDLRGYTTCIDFIDEPFSKGGANQPRVCILGTEEFLLAPAVSAALLDFWSYDIFLHSTTRSPIMIQQTAVYDSGADSNRDTYPLHFGWQVGSLYAPDRKAYLYDPIECDAVYVLTDSVFVEQPWALDSLRKMRKIFASRGVTQDHFHVLRMGATK